VRCRRVLAARRVPRLRDRHELRRSEFWRRSWDATVAVESMLRAQATRADAHLSCFGLVTFTNSAERARRATKGRPSVTAIKVGTYVPENALCCRGTGFAYSATDFRTCRQNHEERAVIILF